MRHRTEHAEAKKNLAQTDYMHKKLRARDNICMFCLYGFLTIWKLRGGTFGAKTRMCRGCINIILEMSF